MSDIKIKKRYKLLPQILRINGYCFNNGDYCHVAILNYKQNLIRYSWIDGNAKREITGFIYGFNMMEDFKTISYSTYKRKLKQVQKHINTKHQ